MNMNKKEIELLVTALKQISVLSGDHRITASRKEGGVLVIADDGCLNVFLLGGARHMQVLHLHNGEVMSNNLDLLDIEQGLDLSLALIDLRKEVEEKAGSSKRTELMRRLMQLAK